MRSFMGALGHEAAQFGLMVAGFCLLHMTGYLISLAHDELYPFWLQKVADSLSTQFYDQIGGLSPLVPWIPVIIALCLSAIFDYKGIYNHDEESPTTLLHVFRLIAIFMMGYFLLILVQCTFFIGRIDVLLREMKLLTIKMGGPYLNCGCESNTCYGVAVLYTVAIVVSRVRCQLVLLQVIVDVIAETYGSFM